MGTIIDFPAERRMIGSGMGDAHGVSASVIILPVIRIERQNDKPTDGFEPQTSSPRGKRRKR
jgi:hypothetical protein